MTSCDDSPATVQLGQEQIPAEEERAIEVILTASVQLMDATPDRAQRNQHAKPHGCVEAEFTVDDGVPEVLRHGLFARPGTYNALVRFSNGGKWDDRQGDAHGMAIKVMGVGDEREHEQDFLLVDSPVFFLRNAADYARFSQSFRNAKLSRWGHRLRFIPKAPQVVALAIMYVQFFRSHRREFRSLRTFTARKPFSPLATRYWSTTPYRLGPHAIRFSVQPVSEVEPAAARSGTPEHRLHHALRSHLEDHDAGFDFLVQRQTDPVSMPVEDPTVDWDEQQSPYVRVARVRIPSQSFDHDERVNDCEQRSFQPWNCLPEHAPLGGINRVRKAVYAALYRHRRAADDAARPDR